MCTMKYTAVFLMLWAYISAGGPGQLVGTHGIMNSIKFQQIKKSISDLTLVLRRVKFRAEHASKNNVYTVFHLFTEVGCRPAFFTRYLHKVMEWPTFLMLLAALNAFSLPLLIP